MIPVDAAVFDDWQMTLLGHYHGSQMVSDKVEYVGSPLELTFGEAFQEKHLIVLDLDTLEKKYIVNDFSPKHLIVTPKDIQDENYNLNGNFVRLTVDSMTTKELIDLKRTISQNHSVLSLDTKQKERRVEEDQTVIQNAQAILLDIEQMLEKHMTERGVPTGLDDKKLLTIGKRCLEKKI
jgi:hypothetical protein